MLDNSLVSYVAQQVLSKLKEALKSVEKDEKESENNETKKSKFPN